MKKEALLNQIRTGIRKQPHLSRNTIEKYRHLVRPGKNGGCEISIWSDAIEAALTEGEGVYLPDLGQAYYLDRPIVLAGNQCITADPQARINAVDGMTTCLVRNAHVRQYPDDRGGCPDSHISISGGIWSAEKHSRAELSGQLDQENSTSGAQGTFIFTNVSDLVLTGLKFEQCSAFAIQASQADHLYISDIDFDVFADGIHLNGPLNKAIVKNLTGRTGDDFVALNAWDWIGSAITFGPIEYVWVQNIKPNGGHKAMRFLAGVKTYADATTRDCPINHVVVQQVQGIDEYKLYAQPETYIDYPEGCVVGKINGLHFEDIDIAYSPDPFPEWNLAYDARVKRGVFEILADVACISFERIRTDIAFAPGSPALIDVGPKSATLRAGSEDPRRWREVFLPDGICTVNRIFLADISGQAGKCREPELLVREICLAVNPEYPAEVPRGGTGYGRVKAISLDDPAGGL